MSPFTTATEGDTRGVGMLARGVHVFMPGSYASTEPEITPLMFGPTTPPIA